MGVCLWSAVVFLAAMVGGPQRSPLRFDELHHEYIGQTACLVGAAVHSKFIIGLGSVVAADDAVEHITQRVSGNLRFQSPLTLGYRFTLGRLKIVSEFNDWLDRLLR